MAEWLSMGGHGFFIWSSYGMLAVALLIEVVWLRRARRNAIAEALAMRDDASSGREPGSSSPRTKA